MSPRKSTDASSKADVSAARFVITDEEANSSPPHKDETVRPPRAGEDRDSALDDSPSADKTGVAEGAGAKDKEKDGGAKKDSREKDAIAIEDLVLPKSIIDRLAKGVLEPNTQIQANARLALSKSATVFVNYLATHANEHTQLAGRKTIDPNHVFKALEDTELSFLRPALEAELAKFIENKSLKRMDYRNRKKTSNEASTSLNQDDSRMGDVSSLSAPNPDDTFASASASAASHKDRPATEHRAKKAKLAASASAGAAAAAAVAAAAAATGEDTEVDDAETEVEAADEDDDEDEPEEEEDDEDEEDDESGEDETQDATMEDDDEAGERRARTSMDDEALDEEDSD